MNVHDKTWALVVRVAVHVARQNVPVSVHLHDSHRHAVRSPAPETLTLDLDLDLRSTVPSTDPLELLSSVLRSERRALVAAARAEGASPEDALECVQDALCTFLRIEREGRLPTEPPAQTAALFTMVKNAARNARRRHHRVKPHDDLDGNVPAALPNAEELLVHAEDTVRLRACITELCGVQRAVVTLRLLEERSGEDVAEALGISRGYVDVLTHRAKASLRMCMRAPKAR